MFQTNAIVDENNRTLAFIEAKEYSNALQSSLSVLNYQHRGAFRQSSQYSEASPSMTLDECMMLLSTRETSGGSEAPFVFDRGILIPPSITDWRVITPAIIFNSGLAHHMVAETDESSSSTTRIPRLARAKHLYQLAYSASEAASESVLFRFALINNIAVIDRQIGNTEDSDRNFQGMLSMYMLFLDQRMTRHLRYLQGFLSNLSSNDCSVAA